MSKNKNNLPRRIKVLLNKRTSQKAKEVQLVVRPKPLERNDDPDWWRIINIILIKSITINN